MLDHFQLYRKLVLVREAEKRIQEENHKDEMKTPVHLGIGSEAIAVGVIACMPENTKYFGTYRNHALYLALTEDTDGFFGELYGKETGPAKGKAGSMHISSPENGLIATSAVVGTTIPVAVGAALANKLSRSDGVVAVFFGDGAMEEGVFWESLNFACLHNLKIIFICEDNDCAIHALKSQRQAFDLSTISGFRCRTVSAKGSSLCDVMYSMATALKWTEELLIPIFAHFTYLRFFAHVGVREDWNAGYRPKPSPEELRSLDPIAKFEEETPDFDKHRDKYTNIYLGVKEKIDRSVLKAKSASFPLPEELGKDVLV